MERHLRGRRAHRRLVVAAACAALAACVPLAPFERPPPAAAPDGVAAVEVGPATPPDLPEPGDSPLAAIEPAPVPAPAPAPAAAASEGAAAPTTEPEQVQSQPEQAQPEEVTAEDAQQAQTEPQAGAETAEVAPQPAPDPAQAEVRAALEAFYDAYNARDWKRARAHFWDGATISGVRPLAEQPTPVVKVTSVAEFFDEFTRTTEAGAQGFEGRLEGVPEVRAASNVAQAWCHFQARFGGPQESMSWRRVDAFTFVLHEGTWKIASLAQSTSFDAPVER